MRVTHSMIVTNVMNDVRTNLARMNKTQQQISSGKRYTRASDNPTAVARSMNSRTTESRVEQYQRNVDNAVGWLNTSDAAIQAATDVIQRARELAVMGGNDALPDKERELIAQEVDQLLEQLTDLGNTKFNGSYIFAGQLTETPAYTAGSPPVYQGDTNDVEREINDGVQVAINIHGPDAFGSAMQSLVDLADDLRASDANAIRNRITDLDAAQDDILTQGALIGARTNRIEMQEDRLIATRISLESLRSEDDSVDIVEAIVRFNSEETVYNASLQAGAKIMQPSLLDFIR